MSDEANFEYPLPGEDVEITAPSADEADDSRPDWQDEAAKDIGFEEYKARKRAELGGMGLAWWGDTSFTSALEVLDRVINSCVETAETVKIMRDEGLPDDLLSYEVTLDLLAAPIVMSALQAFGVLEPLLRTDIEAILKKLADGMPEPTEEQNALLSEVGERAVEARFKAFANDMAAQGAVVVRAEDLLADEPQVGGSDLN